MLNSRADVYQVKVTIRMRNYFQPLICDATANVVRPWSSLRETSGLESNPRLLVSPTLAVIGDRF